MKAEPIVISHPGAGTIRLPGIDCKRATEEITQGIVDYLVSTEASGITIGLSGGVDSSLTAVLCKRAIDRIEKTAETRFHALIMPSDENEVQDQKDAEKVAEFLGLTNDMSKKKSYAIVPIQSIVNTAKDTLPTAYKGIPYENLQSRVRMSLLYGIKESTDTRVAGTGNNDEDYGLGFFTKYGDGGVDFSPIAALPKRLVRILAKFNKVPQEIIDKPPSAGLRMGQTDQADLGCSYLQAEIIVAAKDQGLRETIVDIAKYAAKDKNLSSEFRKHLKGINAETVAHVLHRHEKLAPHKLNIPPVIKVNFD